MDKKAVYQYSFLTVFAIAFYFLLNGSNDIDVPMSNAKGQHIAAQQQRPLLSEPQKEFTVQEITAAFQQKTSESLERLKTYFATHETTDSCFSYVDSAAIDIKKTDSLLVPYKGIMQVKTYMANKVAKSKSELDYNIFYSWQNNVWVVDDYNFYAPLVNETFSSKGSGAKGLKLLEALKK